MCFSIVSSLLSIGFFVPGDAVCWPLLDSFVGFEALCSAHGQQEEWVPHCTAWVSILVEEEALVNFLSV